nr:hypothetical protein [Tanacetum cinerariifolium]
MLGLTLAVRSVIRRCDAVSHDPAMIKHFKDGFLDEEDDKEFVTLSNQVKGSNIIDPSLSHILDMQTHTSVNRASGSCGSSGTSSMRLKHTNHNDSDINRVIDMDTPNKDNEGSGLGGSSSSKRVFIDLDDIESDEDKGGSSNKTRKLVAVKVEKEDT